MSQIYILGSGAMGCLWASYLCDQHSVQMIQRQPLTQTFKFMYLPDKRLIDVISTDITNIEPPIERLILATKAYDALSACQQIAPKLHQHAQVILLQNGLGSQQHIQQAFPDLRLYGCSSTEGANMPDKHTLVHAGKGINTIGALHPEATANRLRTWLPNTIFEWCGDITQVLWRKWMINCAINPLTFIYQCTNGELLNQPEYYRHMVSITDEIDAITQAKGYQLPSALSLAEHVCKLTANNISSMLQDRHNQRDTEIAFMTGYLLEQARNLGVPCPVNQMLYKQIDEC